MDPRVEGEFDPETVSAEAIRGAPQDGDGEENAADAGEAEDMGGDVPVLDIPDISCSSHISEIKERIEIFRMNWVILTSVTNMSISNYKINAAKLTYKNTV